MLAIALTFLRAYWKPLAVIAILASLVVFHKISVGWAHHEGYVEGRAVLQPELDLANSNVQRLREQVTDANKRIDGLADEATKRQAAAAKALADEQAKSKVWQEQATKLMGIIARAPSHDPEVCNRADSLLDPRGL